MGCQVGGGSVCWPELSPGLCPWNCWLGSGGCLLVVLLSVTCSCRCWPASWPVLLASALPEGCVGHSGPFGFVTLMVFHFLPVDFPGLPSSQAPQQPLPSTHLTGMAGPPGEGSSGERPGGGLVQHWHGSQESWIWSLQPLCDLGKVPWQ